MHEGVRAVDAGRRCSRGNRGTIGILALRLFVSYPGIDVQYEGLLCTARALIIVIFRLLIIGYQ